MAKKRTTILTAVDLTTPDGRASVYRTSDGTVRAELKLQGVGVSTCALSTMPSNPVPLLQLLLAEGARTRSRDLGLLVELARARKKTTARVV